jgi:hypothetical protein
MASNLRRGGAAACGDLYRLHWSRGMYIELPPFHVSNRPPITFFGVPTSGQTGAIFARYFLLFRAQHCTWLDHRSPQGSTQSAGVWQGSILPDSTALLQRSFLWIAANSTLARTKFMGALRSVITIVSHYQVVIVLYWLVTGGHGAESAGSLIRD